MPSENICSIPTTVACGEPITATGSITYAGTTSLIGTTGVGTIYQQPITTTVNTGWVSGTTSVSTYGTTYNQYGYEYAKEGEVYMDPDTGEWSIFISELGGWIKCEIEGIKKTVNENGKKINILEISFDCNVSYMKKQERERKVMTEKIKKQEPIPMFSGSFNINGMTQIIAPYTAIQPVIQPTIYTAPENWITYTTGTDNSYYIGDIIGTTTTNCSLNTEGVTSSNNKSIKTVKLI